MPYSIMENSKYKKPFPLANYLAETPSITSLVEDFIQEKIKAYPPVSTLRLCI